MLLELFDLGNDVMFMYFLHLHNTGDLNLELKILLKKQRSN